MSRSGYYDDGGDDLWALICWRGAVKSALRGARGQAFLREMAAALDMMPVKQLIRHELIKDGSVCAIGAVGRARRLDRRGGARKRCKRCPKVTISTVITR